MNEPHPLRRAIALIGLSALARHLEVTHQAVRKWDAAGRKPRTEWTGETAYSKRIEAVTEGKVGSAELLAAWPKEQREAA